MANAFGWPHLLIILAVLLLLFGAAKLPALAKSIGQSARAFRGEMKAMKDENGDGDAAAYPGQNVAPNTVSNTAQQAVDSQPGTSPSANKPSSDTAS